MLHAQYAYLENLVTIDCFLFFQANETEGSSRVEIEGANSAFFADIRVFITDRHRGIREQNDSRTKAKHLALL